MEQLCLITKNISAILIYILMWNLEPEPKFLAQEYLQIHQHWKKTYQNAIHFMNILQLTRKPVFTYSPYKYSWSIFSSPELKAQVSFSDHLSSVVCLSVCPFVCLSVRPSVNFSHFHLLLQNHWANFNHTWHKAPLVKGIQVSSNEGPPPFSKGR